MSKLVGGEGLHRRLLAIKDRRGLLKELQIRTVEEANRLVPRQTGHLGRSIVPGPVFGDSAWVHANTNYAAYVEFGTKPHVIKPVRARFLAWPKNASDRRLSGRARTRKGKPVGPIIVARLVNHPGTKPQPFLVPGAKAAVGSVGRDFIIDRWNKAD
jgi:hypothetical protein